MPACARADPHADAQERPASIAQIALATGRRAERPGAGSAERPVAADPRRRPRRPRPRMTATTVGTPMTAPAPSPRRRAAAVTATAVSAAVHLLRDAAASRRPPRAEDVDDRDGSGRRPPEQSRLLSAARRPPARARSASGGRDARLPPGVDGSEPTRRHAAHLRVSRSMLAAIAERSRPRRPRGDAEPSATRHIREPCLAVPRTHAAGSVAAMARTTTAREDRSCAEREVRRGAGRGDGLARRRAPRRRSAVQPQARTRPLSVVPTPRRASRRARVVRGWDRRLPVGRPVARTTRSRHVRLRRVQERGEDIGRGRRCELQSCHAPAPAMCESAHHRRTTTTHRSSTSSVQSAERDAAGQIDEPIAVDESAADRAARAQAERTPRSRGSAPRGHAAGRRSTGASSSLRATSPRRSRRGAVDAAAPGERQPLASRRRIARPKRRLRRARSTPASR